MNRLHQIRSLAIGYCACTLGVIVPLQLGGCAEEPRSPASGLTEPIHPPAPPDLGHLPPLVEIEGPYSMYVVSPIQRVCGGPDPFFAFDTSRPLGSDQPTMTNLIACMNNGPLQGKAIRLIGHADPRGTSVYNAALGLKRAERVKQFLVANGIAPGRIETDSMGSDNAMKAPSGWALDRRVEVQLAP